MGIYALECKNCGGKLNPETLRCDYCGTQYERENQNGVVHYIQTCPAEVKVLRAQVKIPNEHIMMGDAERISEYTLKEMAHCLANELLKYTKIEKEYDPYTMTQMIRGTVRVVKPDFRF